MNILRMKCVKICAGLDNTELLLKIEYWNESYTKGIYDRMPFVIEDQKGIQGLLGIQGEKL